MRDHTMPTNAPALPPLAHDYILDNDVNISDITILFHTANPIGRMNMVCYWTNFKENYKEY